MYSTDTYLIRCTGYVPASPLLSPGWWTNLGGDIQGLIKPPAGVCIKVDSGFPDHWKESDALSE